MKMKRKRLLSILLSLALMLGMLSGMSLTAYATNDTYTITVYGSVVSSNATLPYSGTCTVYNDAIWDGWINYPYTESSFLQVDGFNTVNDQLQYTVTGEGEGSIFVPYETYRGDAAYTINISCLKNNPTHTHAFTYSATGATITATCTADGCDLPPSTEGGTDHVATLTIAAPESLTYDGNAKAAVITDENSIQGEAKVQYQKKTDGSLGESSETAPTDAGDYKASITVGGATASVEYTIAKADPTTPTTVTITPSDYQSGDSITKDGVTVSSHIYTNPSGIHLIGGGGTFTSSVGNITKIVVNANTSTISGEGWSGNTWTGDSSSVPFGSNINSFKELICTVELEPTPGEQTATYGDTLADVTLPDGWAWVDDTTSVGSVGTHTFKANFTPEDTANYNTLNNVDVTVKVNKAANPATVTDTATVTKGGNTVDLAGNVTKNSATGDVSYAISGEANGCSLNGSVLTSGNTAGTVTVNVTVAADANYNALAATPITVTINEKQTQTITVDDVTVTYGDTGKSIAATSDGDGNLSYAVKSGDAVTVNETTGALTIVKAGSAVITVTATETDAYAQATKDVNVTVDKADPVANAPTGLTAIYGDTLADVPLEDKNPAGNTLGTWAWKDDTTEVGNAGSHTFKADFTPTDTTNYNSKSNVNVTVMVGKADPIATAPTATATFGQTLADVTLTNPTGNTAGTWAWVDATTTSVGAVGSNTFKANFTPTDTTNYNSKSNVDVTVTVGKAVNPATVTGTASVIEGGNTVDLAANVTKNGAVGDVSYEISGEANGCSLNGSVLTSGNTTGTVTVNVTVAADDNYNALTATPITVTINEKQTQTIIADDVTVTFGDTGKTITATTDGGGDLSYAVKSGDAVTVDASTGALTIVKSGNAVITVTAAETATYAQATKDVNITVNQVNSSGKVTAVSGLVYDGTAKALVDSNVHGGIFMYRLGTDGEWTEEIPEAADFGTYTVYYYIKGDGNHKDNGSETEPMGSVDVTIKCPYSNEWVDGKWYNKNGTQTYKPLGSWKKDGKDWMYADSSGWYAKNRWQKIDFKWYFFDKEGHMLKDAYQKDASGKIWYLGKNGAWDEKAAVIGWKQDSKGWWFGLYGKEYLKSTWKMINGNWYYFKADGYVAQNEFINGWWCNKNGVQSDPVKYSWHKTSKGWWYGVSGGWYAKNATYTIDGKSYTFDKMGYQK